MHGRLLGVILFLAALTSLAAASGCGTCVSVEATYDEAWTATREALLAQRHMRDGHPEENYGAGMLDAVVVPPNQGIELHYHATISPVGGDQQRARQVCVSVRELEAAVVEGLVGDQTERMQAIQRRDLESVVTRRVEAAFDAGDESE